MRGGVVTGRGGIACATDEECVDLILSHVYSLERAFMCPKNIVEDMIYKRGKGEGKAREYEGGGVGVRN